VYKKIIECESETTDGAFQWKAICMGHY